MSTTFRLKIFIFLALSTFLAPTLALINSKAAQAEATDNWSWGNGTPTVISSNVVNSMGRDTCRTPLQSMNIEGESAPRKLCVTGDSQMRVGAYFEYWGWTTYVSFGYETKMYKLNGGCNELAGCLYLPGSNTMIMRASLVNPWTRNLMIFKNLRQRIHPTISGLTVEYDFDTSSPDYIFKNSDNYIWPIGAINASKNGKWLAVEFMNMGIGLLNLDTLNMKRITNTYYGIGYGSNPSSEFDVTDNGQTLVIAGSNSGFTIYDGLGECGDEIDNDRMVLHLPVATPCKTADINTETFIHNMLSVQHPRFNFEGGELSFFTNSYDYVINPPREVIIRATGYGGQRMDYLALGDSFSSGEGETDDGHYLPGTNDQFEKCHTSDRSYPYLIASMSNINPVYTHSVACSGAQTRDVVGDDSIYAGQGNRLGKDGMQLASSDIVSAQTSARYSFIPGRVHQENFTEKYQPNVITIGIGGNDAGLMDKLRACVGSGTCNWASDPKAREQTALEIKGIYGKLVQTYQELHATSPNSKIYALGYPKVVDETGNCGAVLGGLLDGTERRFMNESVSYLNQVVEAAAKEVGIKYVNIENSFGDQVMCGSAGPSAMNDIRAGNDNSPISSVDWFKVIGQESFHPNPLGNKLIADTITSLVGNIVNDSYCAESATVCPVETPAPDPSTYWVPDNYHDYPALHIANFTSGSINASDNHPAHLVLDDSSLAPSSTVSVELTSTPTFLGQFTTTITGGLDVNVDLPTDLPEGFHTIHLIGTSYSGESVELYQIIGYRKPTVTAVNEPTSDTKVKKSAAEDTVAASSDNNDVHDLGSNGILGDSITNGTPAIHEKALKTPVNSLNGRNETGNVQAIGLLALITLCIVFVTNRYNNRG